MNQTVVAEFEALFVALYQIELSNGGTDWREVDFWASGWNEACAIAKDMTRGDETLDSLNVA